MHARGAGEETWGLRKKRILVRWLGAILCGCGPEKRTWLFCFTLQRLAAVRAGVPATKGLIRRSGLSRLRLLLSHGSYAHPQRGFGRDQPKFFCLTLFRGQVVDKTVISLLWEDRN